MDSDNFAPLHHLPLTLAFSDYDHVRDLMNGRVVPEGIQLTVLNLPIEEIFYRFIVHREWDVSEMAFGKYASMLSQGDVSLSAIPVFPSRIFRHSSIFVRRDGPVRTPADLTGRRVGLPEWAQTAAIYSRGFLAHQYGIDLASICWIQAGVNQPGRTEKVALRLPSGVTVTSIPDKSLSDMLVSGELDAVLSAHPPACFEADHPNIRRLFEDFVAIETAYLRDTGIFPIMHVVAIRSELVQRHPWIARTLTNAFEEAKKRSLARALDSLAPRFPIPWGHVHAEQARATFGEDFWPYGIDPNRKTLEAFLGFAHEQGVCHRRLSVDELFPAQLRSSYKI